MQRPALSRALRAAVAGAVGAAALAFAHAETGVHHHAVTIGQSLALSGPGAAQARAYHDGARLYFERVNASGGVHGRKIELRTLDDRGDAATAAANTRKLLDMGVLCLFGYAGAPQVAAAHALAREAGVLLFAPLTAADAFHGPQFPNVYTLRPGYAAEAAAIAHQLELGGARRLAVLHTPDAEALAALEAAQQVLGRPGVPLSHAVLAGSDVAAGVDQVLATRPDAVILIADASGSAIAVRYLRARRFHGLVYGFSMAGESLLAQALGAEGAGVVVTRVVPRADNPQTAIARQFLADAATADAGKPNVYMLEGYLAAHAFAQALRGASPEPGHARLKQAIERMHDVDLGGFRVHFGKDRMGSRLVELALIDSQGRVRE